MFSRKYLAVVVGLGLTACGPKVASIDVQPNPVSITRKGEGLTLKAVAKDAKGNAVEKATLTFTSSDPAVATIDAATGAVNALKSGDVTVKVAFGEKVATEVPVKVSIPTTISITPPQVAFSAIGEKVAVTAKVIDELGREVATDITWESPTPDVVTWQAGELVAAGAGNGQVFAVVGELRAPIGASVPAPVAAIEVSPTTVEMKVGAAATMLQPVAKDAAGNAMAARYTFTSADPAVATVDASGAIVAVAKGKTQVTVTSGAQTASVEVAIK